MFAFCHVVQIPGTSFDPELCQWQQQRRDMIAESLPIRSIMLSILKRLALSNDHFGLSDVSQFVIGD